MPRHVIYQSEWLSGASWRHGITFALLAWIAGPVGALARETADPGPAVEEGNILEKGNVVEAGRTFIPDPPPDAALPVIDDVISDSEFNAAIPPLDATGDPELGRPLESIAEFERRMASEQAGTDATAGNVSPPGKSAFADEERSAEVGDAPVRDAELLRPLPPISQFTFEPVKIAETPDDGEDVQVAYRVVLNGMDEADRESEARLRAMFREFSSLREGGGRAANTAMISARLTEDSVLVQRILASEGWFAAQVSTRIEQPPEAGGPLGAVLDVTPGQRFRLAQIRIDAPPTEPEGLIRGALALKSGEPIVADRVQGAEAQVAVTLPQNGYPFAEIGQRDIVLDPDTGEGDYTLPVMPGPRSRFGGFATSGKTAFDGRHIATLARFERGELYDSRKVDDLRKALIATGLFSSVAVQTERSEENADDGTAFVTMQVMQQAGPPRTIAASAGYGTGEGLRVEGTWTHRNMFPPEGALIANAVAGTSEQGAGVTLRRSNAGKRDRTFEVVAEALHSTFDAYSAYTGRLAARISRDSTPIWQKRITYAYGVQLLATAEKVYDPARAVRDRRTFYVGGLSGELGLDTSNDLLDPTEGFRITALVEPEASLNGGTDAYVRTRIDGSAYFAPSGAIVLAGRVRLGTIQGVNLRDLAPSRRFYSGGGGSVRGYGYQKLGPQDPSGNPIGGRSLNEAAAEVRYRFGTYGIVGFVDVGQSYAATVPRFSDLRIGAGIGGRFYTNFGPMRVDVATPINRRKGEGRFNVYVSIGQAF